MKLPVIDFSHVKPNTPQWETAKNKVFEAFEQFGSFEATYDYSFDNGVRHKKTMDAIKQLFDLPLDVKLRKTSDVGEPFFGYNGTNNSLPFYENFWVYDDVSMESVDKMANLMWPQGNSSFSESIRPFVERARELDKTVRTMVLEILGLEKYIDEHMDSTRDLLRIHKYDVPESHPDDSALGLPLHTDNNYVTILHQNEVSALDVMTQDGQWIAYDPPSADNSFIVLVADSLRALTNGRIHSGRHRVTMARNRVRFSIGLFVCPKSDYIVTAPCEMVDEEHPLQFKPFAYGEYLNFFMSSSAAGRVFEDDPLKEYCGA